MANSKRDVIEERRQNLVDAMIADMEKGEIPWEKPWIQNLPVNAVTGKTYRGMNCLALGYSADKQRFSDPRWCTFKQAQEKGWSVKAGSKATHIEYWDWYHKTPVLDENGKQKVDENGKKVFELEERERPICVSHSVFNGSQIDGIPAYEKAAPNLWESIETAENILKSSGAVIEHKQSSSAYYSPLEDRIVLPLKEQFNSQEGYYGTALHELGHWTGHESRLDRNFIRNAGSKSEYAKEELRAELASAFLNSELGIKKEFSDSAAYLQSWIKALRDDKDELYRAAYDADKIANYILAFAKEKELTQEKQSSLDTQPEATAIKKIYFNIGDTPFIVNDKSENLKALETEYASAYLTEEAYNEGFHVDAQGYGGYYNRNYSTMPAAEYDSVAEFRAYLNLLDEKKSDLDNKTVAEHEFNKDMVRRAIEGSALGNMGDIIVNSHKVAKEKISFMNLSDAEKQEAIKKITALTNEELNAQSGNPSWVTTGRANYNVNKGINGAEKVARLNAERNKLLNELEKKSDKNNQTDKNKRFFSFLKEAEENGLKEVVYEGKKYIQKSKYWVLGKETQPLASVSEQKLAPCDVRLYTSQFETLEGLGAKQDKLNKVYYVPKGEDLNKFKDYLPKDGKLYAVRDTPITVDFNERQAAKDRGAWWNSESKQWYIPQGEDVTKFEKKYFIPAPEKVKIVTKTFEDFARERGLIIDKPLIADGKMHRVPVEDGKPGSLDGAYKLHDDEHGRAGYVKNYRTGEEATFGEGGKGYKTSENAETPAEITARKEKEAAIIRESQDKAAVVAAYDVTYKFKAAATHPYITKKKVEPHGTLLDDNNNLVIPLQNIDGKIRSYQTIYKDGGKQFMPGGQISGCFYPIGLANKTPKDIIISEGFATGASIHEATGKPVLCAMHAGNLKNVAVAVRERYGDRLNIVIAGDNDHKHGNNPGKAAAEKAADAINGKAVIPEFTPKEKEQGLTDFNDLATNRGKSAVKDQLSPVLSKSCTMEMCG